MASSSSGVDDARLAAEALTIRTLTQQYGFAIETAQNAVKQLGDPSDLELAVTWCLVSAPARGPNRDRTVSLAL